jgi:two-component system sensor histidine kinase MprB
VSLRWKLTLALAVIAALGTGLVGALSYQSTQSRLITEIDRSLVNATDRFLDRRGGGRGDRPGSFDNLRLSIPERPLGIEQFVVQLIDPSGDVLAATEGVTIPVNERVMSLMGGDGEPLLSTERADDASYRLRSFATPIGVVRVGRDLTETDNVLADLRARAVLLSTLVAVVAAVVGWLIALRVTSRLRRLSIAAENVATTGRLNVDAPVTGRDEAGRLGRSFSEMLAALSRSKEQQQRLVEDAGHELRTPLTSLRTNLDVLKRHPAMDDVMRAQILADIDRDTTELSNLVEEVVAVAADRHATELPEPVRLSEAVERVVNKARRRTSRDIVVVADDSIVMVRPALLERAISNLIDNALKFDASDSPIDVAVRRGEIMVSDRGPGIPEADLSNVFERFHRSVTARTMPGSGLGLSIVSEVATSHGGTVFARNRADGGAEVGLTLPCEDRNT